MKVKRKGGKDRSIYAGSKNVRLSLIDLRDIIHDACQKGKSIRFRAYGSSMYPFIRNGDTVTISPCSSQKMHIGYIAAFVNPQSGSLVVHRVIKISSAMCVTKGDNCHGFDCGVKIGELLGLVTDIERNCKSVKAGLGIERVLIAILSRCNLLKQAVTIAAKIQNITRNRVYYHMQKLREANDPERQSLG